MPRTIPFFHYFFDPWVLHEKTELLHETGFRTLLPWPAGQSPTFLSSTLIGLGDIRGLGTW